MGKIVGWDCSCRVFSTLTSLVSVSAQGPRDSPVNPVLGFCPEVVTCRYSVELVRIAGQRGLATRPALCFFPDLKTSSPEPEGGNKLTDKLAQHQIHSSGGSSTCNQFAYPRLCVFYTFLLPTLFLP